MNFCLRLGDSQTRCRLWECMSSALQHQPNYFRISKDHEPFSFQAIHGISAAIGCWQALVSAAPTCMLQLCWTSGPMADVNTPWCRKKLKDAEHPQFSLCCFDIHPESDAPRIEEAGHMNPADNPRAALFAFNKLFDETWRDEKWLSYAFRI